MQIGYIVSVNGKFRDEHLNECWFQTLRHMTVATQPAQRTTSIQAGGLREIQAQRTA